MSDESSDGFEPTEPGHLRLDKSRDVRRPEWPADLAAFYSTHEGVGLDSDRDCVVRIARLAEVTRRGWDDLGFGPPPHAGWAALAGYRIGASDAGDEILYVLSSPAAPPGAVLALGVGAMSGPAGTDPNGPTGSLLLAASLDEWLARIGRYGPDAHGLFPPMDLRERDRDLVEAEVARLNPHSERAGQVASPPKNQPLQRTGAASILSLIRKWLGRGPGR